MQTGLLPALRFRAIRSRTDQRIMLPAMFWLYRRIRTIRIIQQNLEARPHSENVVLIIDKPLFGYYFDHFKGGVRYFGFLEPIYQ